MKLHVYDNGTDWFVAESALEASALYKNLGFDEGKLGVTFKQRPDDVLLSINDGSGVITITCDAWCQANGKGFLASRNYEL